MTSKLAWGILGTGRIAKTLANAIKASKTGTLVAVGSRTVESARKFGAEFGVAESACYGSYDAVVKDPRVQAIYISLPNHLHAEWTVRCAEAGKHILCEKPLAMNYPEAMAMIEAARRAGVFLMEAFMYRCHPQTAKLVELIKSGAIGQVRLIQTNFGFRAPGNWDNVDIRMRNDTGGGGMLDLGGYCVSMVRLIAGAAIGKDFADYEDVKGIANLGQTSRVDEQSVATMRFPNGILATLSCGMQAGIDATTRIYGTEGSIEVPNPWFPGEKENRIIVNRAGKPQEVVLAGNVALYVNEVDVMAANIENKQAPAPCMTWADSLSNMKTLDAWRKAVGLAFDCEKPEGMKNTAAGRPAKRRDKAEVKYGNVAGVKLPISRAVMGSMIFNLGELPLTFHMLDHFFEVGGNCIDTAYVYGGGQSEQAVGVWTKTRGIRDQVVIIGKGAHTPQCDPVNLTKQLHETLNRLQTDYIDLYFMHRDNLSIPVGEFVEVLNEHHKAGRIRAFGGSNWTTARLQEANEYAAKKGLVGMAANSPNLSLARWNKPTWDGCISVHDAESRAWHTKTQMPVFSWSSQANGFFTGRYRKGQAPGFSTDWAVGLVAPTWFNDDNFTRLDRVEELAKKKGVSGTQIAMAWVLSQPFPTFALIGPRTIEETRTSLQGMDLTLTAEELKWLNLEG